MELNRDTYIHIYIRYVHTYAHKDIPTSMYTYVWVKLFFIFFAFSLVLTAPHVISRFAKLEILD